MTDPYAGVVFTSQPLGPGATELPKYVPTPLTADAVRAAVARLRDVPAQPPQMVVHPRDHDRACDLLGVPHGSPLTRPTCGEPPTSSSKR